MKKFPLNLSLISDAHLFEAIHNTKSQFKEIFADIANKLDNDYLSTIYQEHKGVKISMGNELQKCPYQVLDVFRNFDKKSGHNIRILNWWGHGLYVLVFFGIEIANKTLLEQTYFQENHYELAKSSSPWDYELIISKSSDLDEESIERHLSRFGFLQWFKKIDLEADIFLLSKLIHDELEQIFHFHRI